MMRGMINGSDMTAGARKLGAAAAEHKKLLALLGAGLAVSAATVIALDTMVKKASERKR